MEREVLLVRYQTLAANRRHFENLLFGTVAFSWCFGLALWAAITALAATEPSAAPIASGTILLAGALVAHRLLQRERSAFTAMLASWRVLAGENPTEAPRKPRPGAMAVAVAGQCLAGLVLLAAGAVALV